MKDELETSSTKDVFIVPTSVKKGLTEDFLKVNFYGVDL